MQAQDVTLSAIDALSRDVPREVLLNAEEVRFLRRKLTARIIYAVLAAVTAAAVAILFIIVGYILLKGVTGLNLSFFINTSKPVGQEGGGIAEAILGSLVMLAVASLLAIPFGIAAAVYLAEYGKGRFASAVRFCVELLASLPSIVVGVFIWALIVRHLTGFSGLAGAAALAVIMIPIIARSVEEILRLVPNSLREAALALGVPSWRVTMQVVIPAVLPGILTGIVLSVARAAGETAPLMLTALGNSFINFDLQQPMAAIPLQIYNYALSPYPDWQQKSWTATLVLVFVIAVFSAAVRFAMRKFRYVR
ncbi:MAG: phosphate ABC transporter permease PstA [Anaerolineae bacterium]|nr:phosphate ABC transporter permease PstA [Anaerolineae bacterium]MCA9908810.1 phosphate ABC transporter permease PstA [Anaerolineae bacterium]